MKNAKRIFLVGMPGSGKSTEGKKLAKQLGYSFIDLDKKIEEEFGLDIAGIFKIHGEVFFREYESKILKSLNLFDRVVIACGGGTISFNCNMDWINKNGISIYFSAEPKLLLSRILAGKVQRPLFLGLNEEEILIKIKELLAHRSRYYEQSKLIIELPIKSPNMLLDKILNIF
ncbi:MAG: shikimate kinase [bacterium]|nr:shikimate kinase [bacterium]